MTRTDTKRRAGRCISLVLGLLAAGGSDALVPVAVAQPDDLSGWWTHANGDEVIALEVNPRAPRQLWAGTEGGGAVLWDVDTGEFTQYLFPIQPGLASNDVYDIAFDGAGDAWLATGAGVSHAAGESWRAYGVADGLPKPPLRAIAVDAAGTVWAGGPYGLAALKRGASAWEAHGVQLANDAAATTGPGFRTVADIAVARDGKVLVAHGRQPLPAEPEYLDERSLRRPALSILDPAAGSWRHVAAIDPGGDATTGPTSEFILAIAFDATDKLWLASWGKGVIRRAEENGQERWDAQIPADPADRSRDCPKLWALEVVGDSVWVGCGHETRGEGVARWDGTAWRVWRAADGLASGVVAAVAAAGQRVFLGTNGVGDAGPRATSGAGVVPFDGGSFREPWRTAPKTPWSNDITAVAVEADGTLWAGTRVAGLMRFRPGATEWEAFTVESTDGKLPGNTISDLAIRDDGELWVAAVQTTLERGQYVDGGVGMLDLASGAWAEPLRHVDGGASARSLPDNNVGSLAAGSDGRVWIGFGDVAGGKGGPSHAGVGVAAYDPDAAQDAWQVFDFELGHLVAGNTVVDLAADRGEVWAAASYHPSAQANGQRAGGGVSRYASNAWTRWRNGDAGLRTFHGSGQAGDRDAYIDGDVRSVAFDGAGRVWAGTYDVAQGTRLGDVWPFADAVANHQLADGTWEHWVFPRDGWVSAIAEDAEGQVWIGTTRGHFDGQVALQEFSPDESRTRFDTAAGGLRVRIGDSWLERTPSNSGLASNAVTALAFDSRPVAEAMWIGTENSGLSVFAKEVLPTPTATSPVPTALPGTTTSSPPTSPPPTGDAPIIPLTPDPALVPTDVPGGGSGGDEPQPPPEVPEPSTLALLGVGLAGLLGWLGWRRRG